MNNPHEMLQQQGDTLLWPLTLQERNPETDEYQPIDLTDCTITLAVARARGLQPSWVFDAAPEVVITDPAAGLVTITLTPTQTRTWERHERLDYSIKVAWPDGTEETFLDGPLRVRLEVAS